MSVLRYTVPPQEAGLTLRQLLMQRFAVSSTLRKVLVRREKGLLLNGSPAFLSQKVCAGDEVAVDISDEPGRSAVVPVDHPLTVLWEDEHLLAVSKPAGITVHGAALTHEEVTVAGAAAHYLGSSSVHVVNRLDRSTTGVMLIAKSGYMHARCTAILHTADFCREYLAVCEGVPQPMHGVVDAPIGRDSSSLLRRCITPEGQRAVTLYEVLAAVDSRSLVRLLPQTGRTHQLRVHMAHLGCPLSGDWLYGTEDHRLIARPALHASRLSFTHPLSGEQLCIAAPLPEDMAALTAQMRR